MIDSKYIIPAVYRAVFTCKNCGAVMNIKQFDYWFKEPKECHCRNTKFDLVKKELRDYNLLTLQFLEINLDE